MFDLINKYAAPAAALIVGFFVSYVLLTQLIEKNFVCEPFEIEGTRYLLATQATSGIDPDLEPTTLPAEGGYVFARQLKDCECKHLSYSFHASLYGQESDSFGQVIIELYGPNGNKIQAGNETVEERLESWKNISNMEFYEEYKEFLSIEDGQQISEVRVFVVPGTHSLILKDMKLRFL